MTFTRTEEEEVLRQAFGTKSMALFTLEHGSEPGMSLFTHGVGRSTCTHMCSVHACSPSPCALCTHMCMDTHYMDTQVHTTCTLTYAYTRVLYKYRCSCEYTSLLHTCTHFTLECMYIFVFWA